MPLMEDARSMLLCKSKTHPAVINIMPLCTSTTSTLPTLCQLLASSKTLWCRRGADGAEEHVIPLQPAALQQLLQDMEAG